jgi:hypothetical protein
MYLGHNAHLKVPYVGVLPHLLISQLYMEVPWWTQAQFFHIFSVLHSFYRVPSEYVANEENVHFNGGWGGISILCPTVRHL